MHKNGKVGIRRLASDVATLFSNSINQIVRIEFINRSEIVYISSFQMEEAVVECRPFFFI